jgi:hypothetical protein
VIVAFQLEETFNRLEKARYPPISSAIEMINVFSTSNSFVQDTP